MTDRDRPPPHKPDSADYTFFGTEMVPTSVKSARVARVFSSVASRYDIMNDLISGGLHRLWREAMIGWLAPGRTARPYRHLDVAGGTGDIAFRVLDAAGAGATSLVVDINQAMLATATRRSETAAHCGRIAFAVGDAESLPVADCSVDAYTIAFGIRNVTRIEAALAEARRVLSHGGRFLCLELSEVSVPILDLLYERYSDAVIPTIGQLVTGDRAAYQYLIDSIRRFPNQETFAAMISDAGLERVSWRNLTGGIAAIHSAWRL